MHPCLAGNVHYLCHTITPIHRFPSTSHELNSNLPANLTDAKLLLSYVKLSGKFGGVSTARHLRSATATVPPSQDCGLRRVRGGRASRRNQSPQLRTSPCSRSTARDCRTRSKSSLRQAAKTRWIATTPGCTSPDTCRVHPSARYSPPTSCSRL